MNGDENETKHDIHVIECNIKLYKANDREGVVLHAVTHGFVFLLHSLSLTQTTRDGGVRN